GLRLRHARRIPRPQARRHHDRCRWPARIRRRRRQRLRRGAGRGSDRGGDRPAGARSGGGEVARRGRLRSGARDHLARHDRPPDGWRLMGDGTSPMADGTPSAPGPEATTVVIPAFNEAASIAGVVRALNAAAPWREILVVDDGSTDETWREAAAAGAQVIRHPYNKGNGAA